VAANRRRLKPSAPAPAKAAAGVSAAPGKPGAARGARSGGKNRARLRGHGIQIVDERVWIEPRAISAALIPLWRLRVDALKRLAPVFLNPKGQGEGQEFFEHVGRFDHAIVFDGTNLRTEWHKATRAAKCPSLIIHDLRRNGARNLREAGVDETVIMKIGGWKTRSVFIRYGIVATKDIENAMAVLRKKTGTLLKNDGTSMEPASQTAQR